MCRAPARQCTTTVLFAEVAWIHPRRSRGCSANSTSDNSTSASWSKSKLAKVEVGRSRNKLAEMEQMVCALFLLALFLLILWLCLFTFLHFFLVLVHFSLHFVSVVFCFRPRKPEVNPKPRTLHPIFDGPFRWTLPPVNFQGTTLRGTTLRRTAQNFALFFPSSRHNFNLSLSWGGESKARNFGPPTLRGPTLRGTHPSRDPPFLVPKFKI